MGKVSDGEELVDYSSHLCDNILAVTCPSLGSEYSDGTNPTSHIEEKQPHG